MNKGVSILLALSVSLGSVNAQNVGIGVPAPTEKLDVLGTARLRNLASADYQVVYADPNGVLTINAPAGRQAWMVYGNAGLTTGTHFLGTTDAVALDFRTNNLIRFRIPDNAARLLAFEDGTALAPTYSWNADPDIGMYRIGVDILGFATTGVERVRITDQGLVGVNSTTPIARLEAIAGGTIIGILGIAENASLWGGVMGWNSDNVGGTGTGVIGLGNGLTTVNLLLNGSGGAFTSNNVGVYGIGYANDAYGGYFVGGDAATGWSNNNVGVAGVCGDGTNLPYDFIGVYGWANTSNTLFGYGVMGVGNWYGVFAVGDLGATGVKTFIIDHPLDPENKYLRHFSVESNEVLNLYRGVVTLDSKGEAVVTLPDYFTAVNKNFSYQLTPIGAPMPNLFIAQEIDSNGTFKISGGVPNKKVAWVVYAERNDLYLRRFPHKKEVEVFKKPHERGKYLMPKLYGKPDSLGILYIEPKANLSHEIKYQLIGKEESNNR